jgi:hypothetical protein
MLFLEFGGKARRETRN